MDEDPAALAYRAFYLSAGLVDPEFFQQQFIGDLLHLEHDPVPNVRMALARMLAAADLTTLPIAVEVLQRLSLDTDRYKYLAMPARCWHTAKRLHWQRRSFM
jgi:hypothetical protein